MDVQAPPAVESVKFRAASAVDSNTIQPGVQIPTQVQTGDRLLLVISTNRAATASTPAGWALVDTISDGTEVRSWLFTRLATSGDPGTTPRSTLDAYSKTSVTFLAYANAGTPKVTSAAEPSSTTDHVAPAIPGQHPRGAAVIRYWVDKASQAHSWTIPSGYTQRAATAGSASGMMTSVSADLILGSGGEVGSATARSSVSSAKAVSWTVVFPPR